MPVKKSGGRDPFTLAYGAHRLAVEPLEDRRMLSVDFALLKDINSTPAAAGSNPAYFVAVGETVYFTANDGTSGIELWKSDGTAAGTGRVKDIQPGAGSAFSDILQNDLLNVGGTLYFRADDGVSGNELWKTDGTEAGTVRVKDIQVGAASSRPTFATGMIEANGTLFFTANDGATGEELWKSDGTEAGTVRVKDIVAGAGSSTTDFRTHMVNVGGTLYFSAKDANTGDLWKSDGTEAGTVSVKEFPRIGYPRYLANVGGTLYFNANDGSSGRELWKSNGTTAGTIRVRDIQSGNYGSTPYHLTNVSGTLFFTAADGFSTELWKSNGTVAGTVRVKDIYPGGPASSPSYLTNFGGILYFEAEDGVSGSALWKSDGTEAGTVLVKDIHPGSPYYGPRYLTNIGGTLYFSSNDGANGRELWTSDGTTAGTVLLKDFAAGAASSDAGPVIQVGDKLFVAATTEDFGREVWVADLSEPKLQGDYDTDGDVDGHDFLAWQRTLGSSATPSGSGADGDSSGTIDAGDLNVWRDNFPETPAVAALGTVPISRSPRSETGTVPLRRTSLQDAADAIFAAGDFTSLFTPPSPTRRRYTPPRRAV